ncbi:hypothetical protein JOE53_001246 [Microbacterium laevaniformans]|uniref:hypothetical protein n=1 Tax=Microbacterium laevaniformans TaxID=36807 RepID=UPI001956149C|nr:hypothetical protein [Microbacterium laevaniformans]MBM7752526.1 hypothetical protein [Microbacterium laevaniformans]
MSRDIERSDRIRAVPIAHVEPREVDAVAIAWTGTAALVRWIGEDQQEHHAWVYAGAVRRRE